MKHLAKMLLGTLLAAFALLIPVAPANALYDELLSMYIDDDLTVNAYMRIPLPEESANLLEGTLTCELLKSSNSFLPEDFTDLENFKVEKCERRGKIIDLNFTGRLKDGDNNSVGWKITDDEITLTVPPALGEIADSDSSYSSAILIAFPGEIKSVDPDIGHFKLARWYVDRASEIDRTVTITAERNKPSFFSGVRPVHLIIITTLLLIAIAAVKVVVVTRRRKKMPQNSGRSKPDSSIHPPAPPSSENGEYRHQRPAPGSPDPLQNFDRLQPTANMPKAQDASRTSPNMPEAGAADPGTLGMTTEHRPRNEAAEVPSEHPPQAQAEGLPENQPSAPGPAGMFLEQPPVTGAAQPPAPVVSPQNGYPPQYGYFPAPPPVPRYPAQPPMPGYPATTGTTGIPGAAPYPPNVPPQAQPGAPMPSGYYPYPYPYPYPPANPQAPGGGYYPMPNQGYGVPSAIFPSPAAPPQPRPAGQSGTPWHPEQSAPGIEEENGNEPGSHR